ncbi:hypothetical protein ACFL43_00105 [Thermodesulfobacteriota bacterium]
MYNVAIYGAGRLGRQIYWLVDQYYGDSMHVVGFVDDVKAPGETIIDNVETLGSLQQAAAHEKYGPDRIRMIMAIGYLNMPGRREAFSRAKHCGYGFENVIHPQAHVEKDVQLGEGITVLAGAVLDQHVRVGDLAYFDIGVLIGEYSTIGMNNYFAAGTTVGGSVAVGCDNFFGLDTTLVNDITVGNNNFVNAKTLIAAPLDDNSQVIEVHQCREMRRST